MTISEKSTNSPEGPNYEDKPLENGIIAEEDKRRTSSITSDDPDRIIGEHGKGFLPGVSIDVNITDVDRRLTRRLNPYLYTIQVSHGAYEWVVRRRYHHFWHLHRSLILHRTGLRINKKFKRDRDDDIKNPNRSSVGATDNSDDSSSENDEDPLSLPRFPRKPDTLFSGDNIDIRRRQLEQYLRGVLRSDYYRNHRETRFFFEVSEYSFVPWMVKGKEGIVSKRVGEDTTVEENILDPFWCCNYNRWKSFFRLRKWKKLWLIVQDTYVMGINAKTGEIRLVMLFDKDFTVSSGFKQTGIRQGIRLTNLTRGLNLKTWTNRKRIEWTEAIDGGVRGEEGQRFIRETRFGSFAPLRCDQLVSWFVDGEDFMHSVADVIESAKEEIFITDWWLSPEILLKRGHHHSKDSRLDILLKKKADEGIRIFILLYKEFQLALGLNSLYTKRRLSGKNIWILRHPDHSSANPNDHLWAHHEKTVIVDQTYAFVGGIDLCYGRWDTNKHPLVDLNRATKQHSVARTILTTANTSSRMNQVGLGGLGHVAYVLKKAHEVTVTPIRAISEDHIMTNSRMMCNNNSSSEDSYTTDSNYSGGEEGDCGGTTDEWDGGKGEAKKKRKKRRKRKESSAIRMRRKLRSAVDKAKKKLGGPTDSDSDDSMPDKKLSYNNVISLEDENLKTPASIPDSNGTMSSSLIWQGKDYVNFIVKDVYRPDQPEKDNVDRTQTPRMPWHDVSLMTQGSSARDAARHFIQRWNAIKTGKAKYNSNYPFLIPKSYDFPIIPPHPALRRSFSANCQVLRSSSNWSVGIDEVEHSIESAMVGAIQDAERYVYIENQFFITSTSPETCEVKNGIGTALYQRILQAHRSQKTFKVYVLVPLLPAFEGHIGSSVTGNAIRAILHYNYASICRGEHSLFKKLEKAGINPINYISFCALRTCDELMGSLVTELIYIHSKVMIIDDRVVICGSANINDRSLLGSRDSEVSLIIEDVEFDEFPSEGSTSFKSGKFAGSLRRALMAEHLGVSSSCKEVMLDPISDEFYKDIWLKTASVNSKIFDEIFLVVPNDQVRTMEECRKFEEKVPIAEVDLFAAKQATQSLKGSLVILPLQFLENEDLRPSVLAKEGLVPSVTWT